MATNNKTAAPQEVTAAQAYARKRSEIAEQITTLQIILSIHKVKAESGTTTWGHVGDLGSIAEDLENITNRFKDL